MKKLSTISLFVFGVVVTSILTAGLVFYQDSKNNQITDSKNSVLIQEAINKNGVLLEPVSSGSAKNDNKIVKQTVSTISNVPIVSSPVKILTLSMTEIAKHNKQTDCWMLISGKVYDITSYFGKHPGGSRTMVSTCGIDATNAYKTQDPSASSSGNKSAHSSRAENLLNDYYLGDLDQIISQ